LISLRKKLDIAGLGLHYLRIEPWDLFRFNPTSSSATIRQAAKIFCPTGHLYDFFMDFLDEFYAPSFPITTAAPVNATYG
jgi:hypothetical protein